MSFEQTLRDRLRHEAGALPLPDREADLAVGRARTRRNDSRAVAAGLGVAVAAALMAKSRVLRKLKEQIRELGGTDRDWEEDRP